MITYFHFLLLSSKEKEQYLKEHATFLLTQPEGSFQISLYALSNFFVEVYRDGENKVLKILSFKGIKRMSQHAEHIDLSELNVY